jgi:hypothetical protein
MYIFKYVVYVESQGLFVYGRLAAEYGVTCDAFAGVSNMLCRGRCHADNEPCHFYVPCSSASSMGRLLRRWLS